MSAASSRTGHQYVRPVPAYRPHRKRTKTGCFGCRLRRRKCDERKPVCRGCEARLLSCSWPDDEPPSESYRPGVAQSKRADGDNGFHRGVCVPVDGGTSAPITPAADLPVRAEERLSSSCSSPTAKLPPEEILQSPCASILLEHFVSRTSHTLAGRDAQRNPWLYSILPMAYSNSLVMHAVLAISGVHMIHYKPDGAVEQATYVHYGQAAKQLHKRLATWVRDGSQQQDTLYLFLAANLLIMYELVHGDSNGNLAHHIRACGEFARHIVAHGHSDKHHDLIGFSLENYVYSALLASLAGPVPGEACESFSSYEEDLVSLLHRVRTYRTFGSLVSCAHRLYELIPEIARYVWCPKRGTMNCPRHDSFEAYKALEDRIVSWSDENGQPSPPRARRCSTAEYTNGVMIRNSLLMLLRYSWIRHRDKFQQAMDEKIQPMVDDNMMLEELLTDSPVVNVSLWPLMITGSMMRKNEQRLALVRRLKAHQTQVPVTSCAVQVLNWLWNDTGGESYGPEALVRVASKHGTRICFA